MTSKAMRELLHLVELGAFDPVLRAKPDGRPESEKKKLAHVQKATRTEVNRYRHYSSARQLVTNFKRDLDSEPAKVIRDSIRRTDEIAARFAE
jgi:hypothetical protein